MIITPGPRGTVEMRATVEEFREIVEWLEGLAPDDAFTKDLRRDLDRIDQPGPE